MSLICLNGQKVSVKKSSWSDWILFWCCCNASHPVSHPYRITLGPLITSEFITRAGSAFSADITGCNPHKKKGTMCSGPAVIMRPNSGHCETLRSSILSGSFLITSPSLKCQRVEDAAIFIIICRSKAWLLIKLAVLAEVRSKYFFKICAV